MKYQASIDHPMKALYLIYLICLLCVTGPGMVNGQSASWKGCGEGLSVAEFDPPHKSTKGDSKITVIKIDPKYYSFKLLCASEHKTGPMTAKQWCKKNNLVAAVNAGMFQADGFINVGYMKNYSHLNNNRLNSYKTLLLFNPLSHGTPDIQVVDRECRSFDDVRGKYNTVIQNIRMISCQGKNTWSQQPKTWSMVALGSDKMGNILFLFTRSPYSVHDFIEILLALPLGISTTMYLEGGPEASLYFSTPGTEIEKYGSFETGFNLDDSHEFAWPIPNVIGIVKKEKR